MPLIVILRIQLFIIFTILTSLEYISTYVNGPYSLLIRASYFILCSVHA